MTKLKDKRKYTVKYLYHRMCFVNVIFHATRNNPRNTNRFYYGFILSFSDCWEFVDEKLNRAWMASKKDFDKMFGIIKALYADDITIELLRKNAEENKRKAKEQCDEDRRKAEEQRKEKTVDDISDAVKKLKEIVSSLKKEIEEAENIAEKQQKIPERECNLNICIHKMEEVKNDE